ncbi:unnamed protein product, partial [marine sediment metagenome]
EWNHYRVHWYNGVKPDVGPAICVDLYREVAGEWQQEGITMYDTNNRWADSETNRCGLEGTPWLLNSAWFDDTEIWGYA